MIKILADSGSTKTEWILFEGSSILHRFTTSGFNADIVPMETIEAQLKAELSQVQFPSVPGEVYMYAASMANPRNRELLAETLLKIWPHAKVEVEHDLLAAARAACVHESGIACILGTGSNSCLYDGNDIVHEIGGQGYLFGDEGSGAHLGKELLRRMLNGYLSADLVEKICQWKGMNKYEIRKEAYQSDRPNVFLSRFSKFISEHQDESELNQLVYDCMAEFLHETVMRYENWQQAPVNFVGSVAFTYSSQLKKACADRGVKFGRIVKSPAEGLLEFHR